jgi:glucokinase
MMSSYFIGVDLGGTKIATSLTDATGELLSADFRPTHARDGAERVLQNIGDSIRAVMEGVEPGRIKGIGVASPGPVDIKQGMIIDAPNLGWQHFGLIKRLEDTFRIPCVLENDANAAAIGEQLFGAAKHVTDLIYITVSTGIGGGIISNGRILHGRNDAAGEIGHMCVAIDGPVCGCGKRGCLEAVSSGTAIGNEARRLLGEGRESSILAKAGNRLEAVNAQVVAEAAREDDPLARAILDKAFTYLGIGIANLIQLLNPEMIIIGGGVSKIGQPLFDRIWPVIRAYAYPHTVLDLPIVLPALGDKCGTLGAAAVAIKAFDA